MVMGGKKKEIWMKKMERTETVRISMEYRNLFVLFISSDDKQD